MPEENKDEMTAARMAKALREKFATELVNEGSSAKAAKKSCTKTCGAIISSTVDYAHAKSATEKALEKNEATDLSVGFFRHSMQLAASMTLGLISGVRGAAETHEKYVESKAKLKYQTLTPAQAAELTKLQEAQA